MDGEHPRQVVIVPAMTAELASEAAAIARARYPTATAVVEVVGNQHRARIGFRGEQDAIAYMETVRGRFVAYRPVHPFSLPAMVGRLVVAYGGGSFDSSRPVYQGRFERIDGGTVTIGGQRIRADQIAEIRGE